MYKAFFYVRKRAAVKVKYSAINFASNEGKASYSLFVFAFTVYLQAAQHVFVLYSGVQRIYAAMYEAWVYEKGPIR